MPRFALPLLLPCQRIDFDLGGHFCNATRSTVAPRSHLAPRDQKDYSFYRS